MHRQDGRHWREKTLPPQTIGREIDGGFCPFSKGENHSKIQGHSQIGSLRKDKSGNLKEISNFMLKISFLCTFSLCFVQKRRYMKFLKFNVHVYQALWYEGYKIFFFFS
jgi:hypothetical protein